jgi:midasin (ATPase involved in ribosome maturation)
MHFTIMKKVLIILFGALTVAAIGCRNDKKQAQAVEELRMKQDSIRKADEQQIIELQRKAREDSIAMALASTFESAPTQPSAYYVVVGSFLNRGNANAYLRTMKATFNDAQIIHSGRWNMVCVGGRFSSYSSAASTLSSVVGQLGGDIGGEEEEEEEDEEDVDEEVADEDTESEDDEEEEEEEEEDYDSDRVGQAWVHTVY